MVCIDLCGHGKSGSDRKRKNYSVQSLCRDLNLILKNEDIPRCVLIGHSLGGMISLCFALNWPERIESIILISTVCKNPLDYIKVLKSKLIKNIVRYFCVAIGKIRLEKRNVKYLDYSQLKSYGSFKILFKNLIHNRIYILMWSFIAIMDFKITLKDKPPEFSTLIISASKDILASRATVDDLKKILSNVKECMLNKREHLNPTRNAKELEEIIGEFVGIKKCMEY
jgi:pimeloyl-ACP methyl ester carboxylesterase